MPTKEAVQDWRGQTMTTTDGDQAALYSHYGIDGESR